MISLSFEISPKLKRKLDKLGKRDKTLALAIRKNIRKITNTNHIFINQRYKNLRHNLSHLKRVQIGSFVLLFRVSGDTVMFEDLVHHDEAYKI